MSLDIKLPPEELNKLISGAILQFLTPEKRDEMITAALAHLMERPVGDPYRQRPSPLQEVFSQAAERVARELFMEELKKPENLARLSELVTKSLSSALQKDDIHLRLADVLASALSGSSR